jgi:thiosulfate/3-mercaptopyruvate sulfurtransferase
MRKTLMVIIFGALLLAGAAGAQNWKGPARPELLVETEWLAEHLDDSKVRVVDARPAEAYTKGHIKGAVHFDPAKLRITDETAAYLPPPDQFAGMMEALGIGNNTRVVIYDDRGGVLGARLWYVLDYYGHRKASLLNGGWNKWTKEERPVANTTPVMVKTVEFKVRPHHQEVCTLDQMKSKIKSSDTVILDARSPQEYTGAEARSKRGGHIPGAVNIEWRNNLTEEGTFKPADELRRMYEQAGLAPNKEVITYCQSGARAAHALFALRLIGFDKSRNYYGSWQEWGNREETPVETESKTQEAKPKTQD